jgi:hypothetical protein
MHILRKFISELALLFALVREVLSLIIAFLGQSKPGLVHSNIWDCDSEKRGLISRAMAILNLTNAQFPYPASAVTEIYSRCCFLCGLKILPLLTN